jgi:hypothetical protein
MSASYGFVAVRDLPFSWSLELPARRILQGMHNDRTPPLLAVDLDQFIEPRRDGLLPQMAVCRSSLIGAKSRSAEKACKP